jgi:hypothetical protein
MNAGAQSSGTNDQSFRIMSTDHIEIRVKGKTFRVPAANVQGRSVVARGTWLKVAATRDEELVEGEITNPAEFVTRLKASGLRSDIFTFPQAIDDGTPRFKYPFEMDNVAAADTRDFTAWWEKLPQETRKNARRAAKKGVEVRVATFDDEFVKGIKAIYDESPVRQGMKFWHYGKDFDTVKMENGTYIERSEFIGAYLEGELIGFMKFVYVGRVARIMQILAMGVHHDKRPMNALIAKAAEVCHQKGIAYLIYSQMRFGRKKDSPLAEFKRRNGFEEMLFPRYYVPLTLKGRIALKLDLHLGLLGILPPWLINFLLRLRSEFLGITQKIFAKRNDFTTVKKAEPADS